MEWTSRIDSLILRPKKEVLYHPPVYPFLSNIFGMINFANVSLLWSGW
jgi:hypothetical protein